MMRVVNRRAAGRTGSVSARRTAGIGAAVELIKQFSAAGRTIAVICHGPRSLIEADVARGRRMTSWPSVRTELANAGAEWVDEEVVICTDGPNPLVSSRNPGDLPAFCDALVKTMA